MIEEKGVDASIEEYFRLKAEQSNTYNFGPGEVMWVGNEFYVTERYEEALKIYELEV